MLTGINLSLEPLAGTPKMGCGHPIHPRGTHTTFVHNLRGLTLMAWGAPGPGGNGMGVFGPKNKPGINPPHNL